MDAHGNRVYDCFIFSDELDLLEIRLNELDGLVDYHVLVEAPYDFKGNRKPLWFDLNKSRYEKFMPKIRYVLAGSPPVTKRFIATSDWEAQAWENERYQRNCLFLGVSDAKGSDIVMVSDADEIPRPSGILHCSDDDTIYRLHCDYYIYNFNRRESYSDWTNETSLIRARNIGTKTPTHVRREAISVVDHAGWHLTWFGGAQRVRQKEQWYPHGLKAPAYERDLLADPLSVGPNHGNTLYYCEDFSYLPGYVQENARRFPHLFDERFIKEHSALFAG